MKKTSFVLILSLAFVSLNAYAVSASKFKVVCAGGGDMSASADVTINTLNAKIAALGSVVSVSAPSYANGSSQSVDDRGGTGGYYYPMVCVTVELE